MARLYLGTSGWMYKDWGEEFYPEGMRRGHLNFLAQEFNSVEVNSSFYHLPRASTFEKWSREVPDDFVFSVKLSRYITHQRKLAVVRMALYRFLTHAKRMAKLGVVLVQLPPSLRFDEALLKAYLTDLADSCARAGVAPRFALEPRHPSFLQNAESLIPLLRAQRVAIVFPHSAKIPSFAPTDEHVTSDFVYVRFHGPGEFAASRYGEALLTPWAARIARWQRAGYDAFIYFNNDEHGHAIHDAREIARQLEQQGCYTYAR